MSEKDRRQFIRTMGLTAATTLALGRDGLTQSRVSESRSAARTSRRVVKPPVPFKLGLASYTLRKFDLEKTLAMTRRVGLEYIAFKSFHLPLNSTSEQIQAVRRKVKAAGLILYGGGVIYMNDEQAVHQAFDYARAAGMKVIIGVPAPKLLGLVDRKVKEYDIQVAIHNHGPTDKVYPTPESAYEKVKQLDPRIGLCNDIGHTQRAGIDPAESAERCRDRLIDVHIKDVTEATAKGRGIEIGRGIINIPKFLKTLNKIGFAGVVSFEYEKDADDPLAGLAESVGYTKGVLAAL